MSNELGVAFPETLNGAKFSLDARDQVAGAQCRSLGLEQVMVVQACDPNTREAEAEGLS